MADWTGVKFLGLQIVAYRIRNYAWSLESS